MVFYTGVMPTDPDVAIAVGHLAGIHNGVGRNRPPAEIVAAKRALAVAKTVAAVRKLVAAWPNLPDGDVARIIAPLQADVPLT